MKNEGSSIQTGVIVQDLILKVKIHVMNVSLCSLVRQERYKSDGSFRFDMKYFSKRKSRKPYWIHQPWSSWDGLSSESSWKPLLPPRHHPRPHSGSKNTCAECYTLGNWWVRKKLHLMCVIIGNRDAFDSTSALSRKVNRRTPLGWLLQPWSFWGDVSWPAWNRILPPRRHPSSRSIKIKIFYF